MLVNEIVKANLTMIHYLLSPQILPEPALVRFRTDLKTHTAQVLLANSITLTPGTITVEMKDGEYLIHCYDKTMGEGLDSSVFVSMLKKKIDSCIHDIKSNNLLEQIRLENKITHTDNK